MPIAKQLGEIRCPGRSLTCCHQVCHVALYHLRRFASVSLWIVSVVVPCLHPAFRRVVTWLLTRPLGAVLSACDRGIVRA
jgi:hypothetical protein